MAPCLLAGTDLVQDCFWVGSSTRFFSKRRKLWKVLIGILRKENKSHANLNVQTTFEVRCLNVFSWAQALLDALESGKLGGAGLDVHWEEPADPADPLYQHPNVQATPHTGVCTHDVIDAYAALLVENIVRRREGRELVHRLV